MKSILVVDVKLMMYRQHHSHKDVLGFLEEIATLGNKLLPNIHKVIFVKDLGQSQRVKIFPNYKGKRKDTKKSMSTSEKNRLDKFLDLYRRVNPLLLHFGNVIEIDGIEADDIASIISERVSSSNNIYLMSSDEDWSRFLTNPNTTMVLPNHSKLVVESTAEAQFKIEPKYKLMVDCLTGLAKESVDGITKLGKGRALEFLKDSGGNLDILLALIDVALETRRYGMVLPSWANCAKDVYERNLRIFTSHTFEDLTDEEKELFRRQWVHIMPRDIDMITETSMFDLKVPYITSYNVEKFFKLTSGPVR